MPRKKQIKPEIGDKVLHYRTRLPATVVYVDADCRSKFRCRLRPIEPTNEFNETQWFYPMDIIQTKRQ